MPRLFSNSAVCCSSADAAAPPAAPQLQPTSKFCRQCGGAMRMEVPAGDERPRCVCISCSYTDYYNPRVIVGAIVEHQGKILLCRRGIQPQRGLWTVPAGFLELNESTAQGAARETWEEAGAAIEVVAPYCHFDIVTIGQAYLLFRAQLQPPYTFEAKLPETLETRLFAPEDIPYSELAFSSVAIALREYVADLQLGSFHYHHGAIVKRQGAGPNEAGSFALVDHYKMALVGPGGERGNTVVQSM